MHKATNSLAFVLIAARLKDPIVRDFPKLINSSRNKEKNYTIQQCYGKEFKLAQPHFYHYKRHSAKKITFKRKKKVSGWRHRDYSAKKLRLPFGGHVGFTHRHAMIFTQVLERFAWELVNNPPHFS